MKKKNVERTSLFIAALLVGMLVIFRGTHRDDPQESASLPNGVNGELPILESDESTPGAGVHEPANGELPEGTNRKPGTPEILPAHMTPQELTSLKLQDMNSYLRVVQRERTTNAPLPIGVPTPEDLSKPPQLAPEDRELDAQLRVGKRLERQLAQKHSQTH